MRRMRRMCRTCKMYSMKSTRRSPTAAHSSTTSRVLGGVRALAKQECEL